MLILLANEAYKRGLSGLEFACGIPGTIGGAIRMNAGAYGGEFKDLVVSSKYLDKDMNICEIENCEHDFSYRHSRFCKNRDEIILSTILQLKEENKDDIKAIMDEYSRSRREKQPKDLSAGSTFKRGEDFITAKLIDECGLKGINVGDAYVSCIHAGFIVNKGNATAKDVLKLVDIIKERVYEKFGKRIELEIEVIGED